MVKSWQKKLDNLDCKLSRVLSVIVEDIIKLSVEDFILSDYVHYPAIPAKMIA